MTYLSGDTEWELFVFRIQKKIYFTKVFFKHKEPTMENNNTKTLNLPTQCQGNDHTW